MKRSVYDIITDRIIEQLDRGVVPWHRPWDGMPKNLLSGKEYRGINTILLGASGYASPYWLTFRQAKQLGGHVRKGQHATPVVFWKWFDTEDEPHHPRPDTDPLVTRNGKPKGARAMLRYYNVFNLTQCDDIPADRALAITEHPFSPIEACERIVAGMPAPPTVHHQEPRAYYRPATDTVNMPQRELFTSPADYYATLFHELGHSTGHERRLGRHKAEQCTHRFGTADYSKEELVAEFCAAFLCGHCRIETATLDNSASYIGGWLHRLRNDKRLAVYAAAAAQKAADYILDRPQGAEPDGG